MTSLQYQAGLGRRLKNYEDSESRGPDPSVKRTVPRRASLPEWARVATAEDPPRRASQDLREDDGSVGTAMSSIVPYPCCGRTLGVSNLTLVPCRRRDRRGRRGRRGRRQYFADLERVAEGAAAVPNLTHRKVPAAKKDCAYCKACTFEELDVCPWCFGEAEPPASLPMERSPPFSSRPDRPSPPSRAS